MYELAYCDDAVSVIGHIVDTLGPLRFPRHHSHCLENLIQYIFQIYLPRDRSTYWWCHDYRRPLFCFLSNSQEHRTGAQLVTCSRAIIQKFANPQILRNLAKLPVCHFNNCNDNLFTWVTYSTLQECSKKTRH